MVFRTDLAIEERESLEGPLDGVEQQEEQLEDCKVTRIKIKTERAAKRLNKSRGNYITLEVPAISDHIDGENKYMLCVAEELKTLLPEEGLVLVAGLGNRNITPDALGPHASDLVLATRHIRGELARVTGLTGLRPVAVVSTGVLGNTGFEAAELLLGLVEYLRPSAIIAVDALASRNLSRLGCTVQLSDTGIAPGAGVNNARPQLDQETLGVPVISMGVPTVVDAATLAMDLFEGEEQETMEEKLTPRGAQMVVTPREIDLLISRASKLIAMAMNLALNPCFTVEEINALVM